MIKLVFCLRRRPEFTTQAFQDYWRGTHAELVRARAGVLGIRRYVQTHTEDLPGLHRSLQNRNDGAPAPYDGLAELWFDSLESIRSDDPERQKAAAELLEDERNFIDLPNSPMWFATEHVIVSPADASS